MAEGQGVAASDAHNLSPPPQAERLPPQGVNQGGEVDAPSFKVGALMNLGHHRVSGASS